MAAPGDDSEAVKNTEHKLQSDVGFLAAFHNIFKYGSLFIRFISSYLHFIPSQVQEPHQSSQEIVHKLVYDIFDKNTVEQGPPQGAKTSLTTTAPLESYSELPSISSSSSLPPGLSGAFQVHDRGRRSRSLETIAVDNGAGWRSRPPPPASNYRGGPRFRGSAPSARGGYAGSPTTSHFLSDRRGGRYGSYNSNIVPYLNQKQAFVDSRTIAEDTPPPGFYNGDNDDCPPPGFHSFDASAEYRPPPGLEEEEEEEEDAPPPGFESSYNNKQDSARGRGGGASGRGNGGYGGQFSNYGYVGNTRERGGRGGNPTVNKRAQPLQTGRGVKILQVPRNRTTSVSSSYTNSFGSSQLNYISRFPAATAGAVGREGGGNTSGGATTERFPLPKTEVVQPVFKEFNPSSQFTTLNPSYIDEASSALRQIAIGGAPTTTMSGGSGGGVGAATVVPTPEQPAPLIPPINNTLQITPLYPQIGIKSIW